MLTIVIATTAFLGDYQKTKNKEITKRNANNIMENKAMKTRRGYWCPVQDGYNPRKCIALDPPTGKKKLLIHTPPEVVPKQREGRHLETMPTDLTNARLFVVKGRCPDPWRTVSWANLLPVLPPTPPSRLILAGLVKAVGCKVVCEYTLHVCSAISVQHRREQENFSN